MIMECLFVLFVASLLLAAEHLFLGNYREGIASPLSDAHWKQKPIHGLFTTVARKSSAACIVSEEPDNACVARRRAE